MRVRHYPLITTLAGVALVIVPALAVWFSTWLRSAETNLPAPAFAEASRGVSRDTGSALSEATTPVASMKSTFGEEKSESTPAQPEYSEQPEQSDSSNFGGFVLADPETSSSVISDRPVRISALPSTTLFDSAADGLLNSSPVVEPEMPAPVMPSESVYDATKHPALAALPTVPSPNEPSVEHERVKQPSGKSDKSERNNSRRSDRSQNRSEGNSDEPLPEKMPETLTDIPGDGIGNPFMMPREEPAILDPKLLQDVLIQTPIESAPVGRVENLIAVTRATGWPVALVRSDLPDDVWWVQQMVGIQGNSFAARVNFGNEYSVSGTAYRMVIVFLDSQEEVRRFRIAKQFEQIPDGVRRSREFRYVRE